MEIIYLVIAKLIGGFKSCAMKSVGRRAPGANNALFINLLRSFICLVVSTAVWAIAGFGGSNIAGNLIIFMSGVGNAINLYFWVLSSGVVSLCLLEVFIMIGSVIIPIFLAPLLYNGESISVLQWLGVLSLFVAVLLFASQEKVFDRSNIGKKIPLMLSCVIGAVGMTVSQKMYSYHISTKGLGDVAYFNFGTFAIMFALFALILAVKELLYVKSKRRADASMQEDVPPSPAREFPLKKVWLGVSVAAISLYVYQYFTTLAATLDSAIYFPMSYSLGMIATLLVDVFAFHEKLTVRRMIGFVFVALAMTLVNL